MDDSRPRPQPTTDWNGAAGQSWVAAQDALDEMFKPFEDLLVEMAASTPRAAVLDIGCGTGSTTIAIQRRLGPGTPCVGVDISAPMLEHARSRSGSGEAPRFVCADAETHAFEHDHFDLLVSRFGVMFFNDPVRALTNLRATARQQADLCFIVWRSPAENPFMTTAERAAASILPNIPPRIPDAPGQFGFADSTRVRRLLTESGWNRIAIEPLDVACSFPESALARYATRLGPLASVLREADEATQAGVLEKVLPAFAPYVHGGRVTFTAACWTISANP